MPHLEKINKNQDTTNTYNTKIQELANFINTYISENFGQLSDSEKHIFDSFRAQYKHNEIPSDLIKLITAWPKIPKSVTVGILAMVDCYL